MTGTRVEIERVTCNKEMKVNRALAETFYEEMEKIPVPSYTEEEISFAARISEEEGGQGLKTTGYISPDWSLWRTSLYRWLSAQTYPTSVILSRLLC